MTGKRDTQHLFTSQELLWLQKQNEDGVRGLSSAAKSTYGLPTEQRIDSRQIRPALVRFCFPHLANGLSSFQHQFASDEAHLESARKDPS